MKDSISGIKSFVLPIHFNREEIETRLLEKSKTKSLKIIHVFVPLCDNEHQGIVPVNSSLGNGMNLRTNLYWGAGYGIKTHFSRSSQWQLQKSIVNPDSNVLERVIYKHSSYNAILIADAYRGDRMKECLENYFAVLAGTKKDSITHGDSVLAMQSKVDLVVFNGHNGLMDESIETIQSADSIIKDAVAIACVSKNYFSEKLNISGGYPLVCTNHLLAPEAYVLHNVIDAWLQNKTAEEIRMAAATGYNNIQKCGIRGASNLFSTGW
ncbi:MAG: hypothetical protein H6607_07655 [Flavobacteriales bacterium]|nr:hypothetical protein [Flavobacteriales bacterium]